MEQKKNRERYREGRGWGMAPPWSEQKKKSRALPRGGGHPHGMKKKSRALPRGGGGKEAPPWNEKKIASATAGGRGAE